MTEQTTTALPPVVDQDTWRAALDDLRRREKAATRELDAIAAQRRRLPMVKMPDYTLIGADGPIRLADVFDGRAQLIVYNHMWEDGAEWQCGGCTGFTSQFTRLDFLDNYDARFVIVTSGRGAGGKLCCAISAPANARDTAAIANTRNRARINLLS